jgi:hypothetical protein
LPTQLEAAVKGIHQQHAVEASTSKIDTYCESADQRCRYQFVFGQLPCKVGGHIEQFDCVLRKSVEAGDGFVVWLPGTL